MRDPMEYMCKHYSPMTSFCSCKVGIAYDFPPLKPLEYPCFGKNKERCEKQENYTKEEIEEQRREVDRILRLVNDGISPCCNAPLDESQVVSEGQFEGHGPRFCSKCKKWVCTV